METESRYLLGPRVEMSPLQTQRGSSGDLSGDLLGDLSGPVGTWAWSFGRHLFRCVPRSPSAHLGLPLGSGWKGQLAPGPGWQGPHALPAANPQSVTMSPEELTSWVLLPRLEKALKAQVCCGSPETDVGVDVSPKAASRGSCCPPPGSWRGESGPWCPELRQTWEGASLFQNARELSKSLHLVRPSPAPSLCLGLGLIVSR